MCIAGEEASVLAGKPSMQNSEFEVYFGCGRYLPSETIGNCRDCTNIYLDPAKGSDFFRRWSKKQRHKQCWYRLLLLLRHFDVMFSIVKVLHVVCHVFLRDGKTICPEYDMIRVFGFVC